MVKVFMGAKEKVIVKEDLQLSLDIDLGEACEKERATQNQLFTSEIKQQRTGRLCFQETYPQNGCKKELIFPKYLSFVGLHDNIAQNHLDLVEIKAFNSMSIFCRPPNVTPINHSSKFRASKLNVVLDSLKLHKRTRSTIDSGMIFTESSMIADPGSVIFSPSGHWFANAVDVNNKLKNLTKIPLIHRLGTLEGNVNLKKIGVKDSKIPEARCSPSGKGFHSPQRWITPPRRQRNQMEMTDKTLVSCSSTNSTSSYQSLYSCTLASTGLLHCMWKDGMPYFMFSVDDRSDVYLATPCKVESSSEKALEYIYLFHSSVSDGKKEGYSDNVSGLVGKMKVSSSLSLSADNLRTVETEFILYGTSEDHSRIVQSSNRAFYRNKRLPKKVVDLFKTNNSFKHKPNAESSMSRNLSCGPCIDTFGTTTHDELEKMSLVETNLSTNLELAAIVVKNCPYEDIQEPMVGGWGLKFLEHVTTKQANSSPHSSKGCQYSHPRNGNKSISSLNVLVPAGLHGGPKAKTVGPSSLTDRWRSGGRCDCGGWDIGCPLTVLNCPSRITQGSPQADAEACNSFDLYIEGAKDVEPTLKMVNIHEGLYFIHFKSVMSALQSFSIGVAIFHSQDPSLSSKKLYRR